MTVNEGLRLVAGLFVIMAVVLGHQVAPQFYLLAVFVGLNQVQSAFTGWCPMMWVLARIGLRADGAP